MHINAPRVAVCQPPSPTPLAIQRRIFFCAVSGDSPEPFRQKKLRARPERLPATIDPGPLIEARDYPDIPEIGSSPAGGTITFSMMSCGCVEDVS
jgi:hypothetical protein